jgi:hypothetical protein
LELWLVDVCVIAFCIVDIGCWVTGLLTAGCLVTDGCAKIGCFVTGLCANTVGCFVIGDWTETLGCLVTACWMITGCLLIDAVPNKFGDFVVIRWAPIDGLRLTTDGILVVSRVMDDDAVTGTTTGLRVAFVEIWLIEGLRVTVRLAEGRAVGTWGDFVVRFAEVNWLADTATVNVEVLNSFR